MARLKKVYVDEKYLRDKKRERIRKVVSHTLVTCWIVGIGTIGYFQDNPQISSVVSIIMGAVSLAYVAFAIYIRVQGWELLTMYDEPEFRNIRHMFLDERRKIIEQAEIIRFIEDLVCAIMGIVLLVHGISVLCGVG